MTYREEIQLMIKQLQDVYDKANQLRDHALLEDKEFFNKVREVLPYAWKPLQKLDNSMSDNQAKMLID